MAAARQRHADRRTRQRQFHLDRVRAATGVVEALEAAFGLVRADLVNTSNPERAHQVASDLLTHLLVVAERIPRRGA